jgi:cytochrome oxidase assembly protein ShyY1
MRELPLDAMTDAIGQGRTGRLLTSMLLTVALLASLGVWQVLCRAQARALSAAINERLTAAPAPLPDRSQWPSLTAANDEFRRVRFTATYESRLDATVYSSGSAERADISDPGTWAFIPARLPTGEFVAINAGYLPNAMRSSDQQDRAVAQLITNEPITMTGYIRFPAAAGGLTPDAERDKRLWFTRDHLAMAQALGWGEVAPFYIDLQAPVPASGVPSPGPLHITSHDDHIQYALVCFSLAGLLMVALAARLRGRMWTRRHQRAPPRP